MTTLDPRSPLDQALGNRPRGKPRSSPMKQDIVPSFPIDYDPRLGKNEPAQRALTSVQKVWQTFGQLDSEGMDRREIAQKAQPALERSYKVVDDARKELLQQREALDVQIVGLIRKGADTAIAAEVRKHVASLGGPKSFAFVNEQIGAGENTVAHAVLSAPAFLSGLTPDNVKTLRIVAERKFASEQVAKIADIDRDVAKIEAAGSRLLHEIGGRARDWANAHAETLKGLTDE